MRKGEGILDRAALGGCALLTSRRVCRANGNAWHTDCLICFPDKLNPTKNSLQNYRVNKGKHTRNQTNAFHIIHPAVSSCKLRGKINLSRSWTLDQPKNSNFDVFACRTEAELCQDCHWTACSQKQLDFRAVQFWPNYENFAWKYWFVDLQRLSGLRPRWLTISQSRNCFIELWSIFFGLNELRIDLSFTSVQNGIFSFFFFFAFLQQKQICVHNGQFFCISGWRGDLGLRFQQLAPFCVHPL